MYSVYRDYPFDAGDAMLSILVGAAFGTFVTRFVWALFGPGLGATEAVMGVGVFVLLSIGYSLPVYYRHLWLLLQSSGIGITSVKLPGAEITFADHGRQVAGVGAKANETVGNSGVPRPSDPRPGLDFLDADVQQTAFPKRDKEYIEFFNGGPDVKANRYIDNATKTLQPMYDFERCLRAYVDLVPDAQLLSIDLKPVLEDLFKIQASARLSLNIRLSGGSALDGYRADLEQNWGDWAKLRTDIARIMDDIRSTFDSTTKTSTTKNHAHVNWIPNSRNPNTLYQECDSERVKRFQDPQGVKPDEYITPFQPYVAIALASLLQAHGSTDEAIDVIATWLDMWKCARGDAPTIAETSIPSGAPEETGGCKFGPVKDAAELSEWFRFRGEFQMNVLLFQFVGDSNIVYHDFLREHKEVFQKFAETQKNSTSIAAALDRCNKTKDRDSKDQNATAIRVLQLLLDDEKSLLESERNFLFDKENTDLEDLYKRGVRLTKFTPECIEPREEYLGLRGTVWTPKVAEYKITAGLLGLAIANRMSRIAASGYERRRAAEIRKESGKDLRDGLVTLKPLRYAYGLNVHQALWSERLFVSFPYEQSYSLAAKAVDELNSSEP